MRVTDSIRILAFGNDVRWVMADSFFLVGHVYVSYTQKLGRPGSQRRRIMVMANIITLIH